MEKYKNEIKSVFHHGVCIGFMCRRSVVFGFVQEIPNNWIVTQTIVVPEWKSGFDTRRDARSWLERKHLEKSNAA